jgi:hypothetical protein
VNSTLRQQLCVPYRTVVCTISPSAKKRATIAEYSLVVLTNGLDGHA